MKLRTAICVKDRERINYIRSSVEAAQMDIEVVEFKDEYDFKESLGEAATAYDIVILDTTLRKEGDGVELARYLRQRNLKVMIAFVTTSTDYYAEAFKTLATAYLLYPYDVKDLHNAINFFYQKTTTERRASWMVKEKGGSYCCIFCRNIVYIESDNRELIIHLEDGSTMECYAKLSKAEQELPQTGFLRCHQSYLINLYFVEEMISTQFTVKGNSIPISRKYQKMAKEVYYNYMFKKM